MYLNSGIFNKSKQEPHENGSGDDKSQRTDKVEVTSVSRTVDAAAGKISAFLGDVFNMRENKKLEQGISGSAGKNDCRGMKSGPGCGNEVEVDSGTRGSADWSRFEGVFFQGES